MKITYSLCSVLLIAILKVSMTGISAGEGLQLEIKPRNQQLELGWKSNLRLPLCNSKAIYEVQGSGDLNKWQTIGNSINGRVGVSDEILRALIAPNQNMAFYRLMGRVESETSKTANGEVFGFGTAFAQELNQLGQITPAQFVSLFPPPTNYLSHISFDPTTARYWKEWQSVRTNNWMNLDYRLNASELDIMKRNGFVVSPRKGTYSFADMFYRIYSADLPVFVSTDAILQAWHFSYQAMLSELESTYLLQLLESILYRTGTQISTFWMKYGSDNSAVFRSSILDAEYFLTVARSLLTGRQILSEFSQDDRVALTLKAIAAEQTIPEFDLFGSARSVDFSQFKVRGYYANTEQMQRYFKCMMWLGRTEFRIAGIADPIARKSALRELGTAIVLYNVLMQSEQYANWERFERCLQVFVGWTDSMTFAQLGDLLNAAGMPTLDQITTQTQLEHLQQSLDKGDIGVQQIRGDIFLSPLGPEQIKLPISFTFSGQKFVLDSWVLAKNVFDEIIWDTDGIPTFEDKVQRRIPSGLDVAFAVFGNSQIVPELFDRITQPQGMKFRDGLYYQHNLAASRRVIDRLTPDAWNASIYSMWLSALRQLSTPTTDSRYPECMRTKSWALKTLNTQLASWTQLRHDTILYAKQSYTGGTVCEYPFGYVEPRLGFWQRTAEMSRTVAKLIDGLPLSGTRTIQIPSSWGTYSHNVDLLAVKTNQLYLLNKFGTVMDTLSAITVKELAHQTLSSSENQFLQDIVELNFGSGVRKYTGWYPKLFYQNCTKFSDYEGSDEFDALVTDVHTDVADDISGDPGCILHEGVGYVQFMLIVVDCDTDRMVYGGPVLSHYEFTTPVDIRKTDAEWQTMVKNKNTPPPPDWTRSFLVPNN